MRVRGAVHVHTLATADHMVTMPVLHAFVTSCKFHDARYCPIHMRWQLNPHGQCDGQRRSYCAGLLKWRKFPNLNIMTQHTGDSVRNSTPLQPERTTHKIFNKSPHAMFLLHTPASSPCAHTATLCGRHIRERRHAQTHGSCPPHNHDDFGPGIVLPPAEAVHHVGQASTRGNSAGLWPILHLTLKP